MARRALACVQTCACTDSADNGIESIKAEPAWFPSVGCYASAVECYTIDAESFILRAPPDKTPASPVTNPARGDAFPESQQIYLTRLRWRSARVKKASWPKRRRSLARIAVRSTQSGPDAATIAALGTRSPRMRLCLPGPQPKAWVRHGAQQLRYLISQVRRVLQGALRAESPNSIVCLEEEWCRPQPFWWGAIQVLASRHFCCKRLLLLPSRV